MALGFRERRNSRFKTFEARLGAALGIGQLTHQSRQAQQLLGQHVAAQLGAPLRMLFKQAYEVVEILHGEGHQLYSVEQKFHTRYATLGFTDAANLDEGSLWPTSFALKELTAVDEARTVAPVKKAVS